MALKSTGTYYRVVPGRNAWLTLTIGTAGLAVTEVTVDGAVVVPEHEGHLRLPLGPTDAIERLEVECSTTLKPSPHDAPNRVDYRLTGGARAWKATLREDPPDADADTFRCTLILYR